MKCSIFVTLLLIFLLGLTMNVQAQRVYFCSSYTSDGEPVGANSSWRIDKESGGTVYILFQNAGSKLIGSDHVYLYVDKLAGDTYQPFEVKTVTADEAKSWVAYNYTFVSSGSYRVTFQDAAHSVMAKDFVTITYKQSQNTETTTSSDHSSGQSYFSSSTIVTGTGMSDDLTEVVNRNTAFTIDADEGGTITFLINNPSGPFNSEGLIVDVWQKDASSGEYNYYDTKKYDISGTNKKVYFVYDFYAAGDYKVTVYTKESTWINTAYLNVTYR